MVLGAVRSPTWIIKTPLPSKPLTARSILAQYPRNDYGTQAHKRERVVILGSGWAGYAFARTLDPKKYERVVISPRSYFVFTPLLASTSVGTLEFRAVLESVRQLGDARFYQGWADDVDFANKTIRVETNVADDASGSQTLPGPTTPAIEQTPTTPSERAGPPKGDMFTVGYDKLVVAVGAYSQTFGIEGVRQHAHFLRDIGDARRIRMRVLSLFERCSYPKPGHNDGQQAEASETSVEGVEAIPLTERDKRSLLHFAVVGGGPTGIEFAAELHDLIYEDLANFYPELLQYVTITVYDVASKVLPMFDAALAKYAMDTFARQGIDVKTEHHLERIKPAEGELGRHGGLSIKIREEGDKEVGAGLVVWSTGLMQNPLVEKMVQKPFAQGGEGRQRHLVKDSRTGGIVTDACLRARSGEMVDHADGAEAKRDVQSLEDVFVIGDCAVIETDPSLPKTAQVASQQAEHLAKMLNRGTSKSFRFRNWGVMTYLGSWKAIHQSSADELRGWVAWVVWRGAYLTKSMSIRNKIMVPVYWMTSWLFGRDISRF